MGNTFKGQEASDNNSSRRQASADERTMPAGTEHAYTGEEARVLLKQPLMWTTGFFLDPQAFEILKQQVIPSLFASHDVDDPVRVWIAGCATGQEAYSVAMLIRGYIRAQKIDARVQIFATDLDEQAIDYARTGVYADTAGISLVPEYLHSFLKQVGNLYHVVQPLREMIIFTQHNLLKDPPFARIDLLVCRNLLAYLDPDMQQRLPPIFFQALKPHGYLFLGPSETIGAYADLFAPIDERWKIFRRREVERSTLEQIRPAAEQPLRSFRRQDINPGALAENILIQRYSPACAVINEQYDIVYFPTRMSRFLEPPMGEPTYNILKMAKGDLQLALQTAIDEAFSTWEPIVYRGLAVTTVDGVAVINLRVEPISTPPEAKGLAIVVFERASVETFASAQIGEYAIPPTGDSAKDMLISQLEGYLHITHEQLQATVERLENSTEALMFTNEALMAMNAKFLALNDELEASKEELQSLNEELVAVNAEQRRKVEELIQITNDRQNLLNSSEIAMVFLDRQLKIKRFTPAIAAVFNLIASDIGRPLQYIATKLDYPDLLRDAEQILEQCTSIEREVAATNGESYYLTRVLPYQTIEDVIDGVVITLVDITARKHLEAALRQSQKMQALGTLAGGIAHDFNNILMSMIGNTELAITDLPPEHPVQESLAEVEKAGSRASDLVRRILTFSRPQDPKLRVMKFQPVIEEALRLLRSTLPAMIQIRTNFAADVPDVSIDPTQVHQVVMNLGTNAAHAIGEWGGTIDICLASIMVDADRACVSADLHTGRYALLSVSDTGSGMDKATLERIFEPFFTTKGPDQGTGLGLSVVHGIMQGHHGAITVHSAPGQGTRFDLYFPAAEEAAAENQPIQRDLSRGHGEHILYVDDEPSIAALMVRKLERLGYRATGYTDAILALQDFQSRSHDFDVVVTDLAMPDMSGFDLARELLQIRPELPIIMTSGYLRPEDTASAQRLGLRDFILKSDIVQELGRVLHELFVKQ
jgi:chemotaxis methyl-accepting protein methylase/signal transduction histidine kinase